MTAKLGGGFLAAGRIAGADQRYPPLLSELTSYLQAVTTAGTSDKSDGVGIES